MMISCHGADMTRFDRFLDRLRNLNGVSVTTNGGTLAVAATAVLMSAIWLSRLASYVGITGDTSWSLPVTIDAGGLVATILWVTTRDARVGTWAQCIALGDLVLSLIGNALSHLIEQHMVPVTPALVIAVGAVYPAQLWLTAHLLVLHRQAGANSQRTPTDSHSGSSPVSAAPTAAAPPAVPTPQRVDEVSGVADPERTTTAPETAPGKLGGNSRTGTTRPARATTPLRSLPGGASSSPKRDAALRYYLDQRAAGRADGDITHAEIDVAVGTREYAKRFRQWLRDAADQQELTEREA